MQLSWFYLNERYDYWKIEIGNAGIWNPNLFQDISIHIRPKSKRYNGLFCRRYMTKNGKKRIVDRIFIYKNSEDFNPVFLDSVLVHEMIHQYIFQNKIKDTSTHGKIFRGYMQKINEKFPGKLLINISDHNPSIPIKGPGEKIHHILLTRTEKHCYFCVINPTKLKDFELMARKYKERGIIKDFSWLQSNDVTFDRYVRCTKTLHGIKLPFSEMATFCQQHNIIKAL